MRHVRRAIVRTPFLLSSPLRTLPDFLIIGAQKGGTTSLHRYLARHPLIAPARFAKEVHFFDNHKNRGRFWYQSHFPSRFSRKRAPQRLTFEATPKYLFDPRVPRRVHRLLPGVRLIALLRNPIDRAWSQYQMNVRRGRTNEPFGSLLRRELDCLETLEGGLHWQDCERWFSGRHSEYVPRGFYADQLQRWLECFPRSQTLILPSERFFADPQAAIDRIADFLRFPQFEIGRFPVHNGGTYPPLDSDLRKRLSDFFRPHNERLYELLGERYDWD